jgi:hypothetical protein
MFVTTIRTEKPSDHPSPLQMAADAFAGYASMTGLMMSLCMPYHLTLMMYRFGRAAASLTGRG